MQDTAPGDESRVLLRRHLVFGWCGLTLGGTLGLFLEGLHAFKAPVYLDADSATTRLMWRLAHAHLGLLSLMSLALAFTMTQVPGDWKVASRWLLASSVCLPLGFLLGGVGAQAGDPGIGVLLVPLGAIGVVMACARATLLVWRFKSSRTP